MIENNGMLFSREWTVDLKVFEDYLKIEDKEVLEEKSRNLKLIAEERIAHQDDTALVIGRFQPPHGGHIYLIEAALAVAKNAVIGIGSANVRDDKNPFTALRRELILRNELRNKGLEKNVRFVYLNDYEDHDKWCHKTLEQAKQWGTINVIVGNNGLVNNIFRKEGYRALEIPELSRKDLMGTAVRADMRQKGLLLPFGTLSNKKPLALL